MPRASTTEKISKKTIETLRGIKYGHIVRFGGVEFGLFDVGAIESRLISAEGQIRTVYNYELLKATMRKGWHR